MAGTDRVGVRPHETGMSIRQAMHEDTEIAVGTGVQDEVPVVRHDAVREHAHANLILCFLQQLLEQGEVFGRIENLRAAVRAINDMVCMIGDIDAGETRHEMLLAG